MAKSDESALTDLMSQTQAVMTNNPMLGPQIEQYSQAQEKTFQEAQAFAEHWFERRRFETQTVLKAVEDVTNGGSAPSDALKTLFDWQQNSMERAFEDFREWVELCTRCAGRFTSAEVEVDKEGIKKVANKVPSSSRTKH